MGGFNNCISSGGVRGNSSFSNSPIHEHEFPFVATEFQAIICNHFVWFLTLRQLGVLESERIFSTLGGQCLCNFNEISDRINDRHSLKFGRDTLVLQFPRTNEVDVGFKPWNVWDVTWDKLSFLGGILLHLGADIAGTWLIPDFSVKVAMPEMVLN